MPKEKNLITILSLALVLSFILNAVQFYIASKNSISSSQMNDQRIYNTPEPPVIAIPACIKEATGEQMTLEDAKKVAAESDCKQGTLMTTFSCNKETGTWWIDLKIEKEGCSPACVIDVATKKAEINWRCTGLVPDSAANKITPGQPETTPSLPETTPGQPEVTVTGVPQ